jgi:hypothetical protein
MSTHKLAEPELAAIEVSGLTRQSFLVRGAIAAGSVYGLSAVGPFVNQALAQGGDSALSVLNFALTLEYLEATFYSRAVKQVSGLSGEVKNLATTIRDNETEHVAALKATIKQMGGKPVKPPTVAFGDGFSSQSRFLALAQTFEDTGVSAYNGAAPALQSEKKLLAAAGAIVQVEARHAAAIRELNGKAITDGAFDRTLSKSQVLGRVKPFVKA